MQPQPPIVTLSLLKEALGLRPADTASDALLQLHLDAETAYLKRLRGNDLSTDDRLPQILLQLTVLAAKNSPYASESIGGVNLSAKDYSAERQRILEPLSWVYGEPTA